MITETFRVRIRNILDHIAGYTEARCHRVSAELCYPNPNPITFSH